MTVVISKKIKDDRKPVTSVRSNGRAMGEKRCQKDSSCKLDSSMQLYFMDRDKGHGKGDHSDAISFLLSCSLGLAVALPCLSVSPAHPSIAYSC